MDKFERLNQGKVLLRLQGNTSGTGIFGCATTLANNPPRFFWLYRWNNKIPCDSNAYYRRIHVSSSYCFSVSGEDFILLNVATVINSGMLQLPQGYFVQVKTFKRLKWQAYNVGTLWQSFRNVSIHPAAEAKASARLPTPRGSGQTAGGYVHMIP